MSDSEIVIGLLDSLVDEDYERGGDIKLIRVAEYSQVSVILIIEQIMALGAQSFKLMLDMALGALKLVLGTTNLALGAHK